LAESGGLMKIRGQGMKRGRLKTKKTIEAVRSDDTTAFYLSVRPESYGDLIV
jgi:hypothetical protein